jgi:hypothetical protein
VKTLLVDFNKAFENRARLGIMCVLMVNDVIDFTTLKQLLDLSDGNLASHIKAMQELKYIAVEKQFIKRKPNTSYSATREGKKAFVRHLKSLENLINSQS